MKVHVYTDIDTLLGRASRVWMDTLLEAGHEVEFVDLGTATDVPLPDVGPCDINLLVVGIYALPRFARHGLPRHGRHVLWMFDPLTEKDCSVHRHKAQMFDAVAPGLHAVMAMDASVEQYVRQRFPAITTFRLPYMVAAKHVKSPLEEAQRTRDVIFLGAETPRRCDAEKYFVEAPGSPGAEFIWNGLWGQARDACRAASRISLSIHADAEHTYFDQFRAFEIWAAGTVVVSDHFDDWAAFGVQPGVHLVMADLQDMPQVCAELLADVSQREAMVKASQALLRERFTPAVWRDRMLAMIESLV